MSRSPCSRLSTVRTLPVTVVGSPSTTRTQRCICSQPAGVRFGKDPNSVLRTPIQLFGEQSEGAGCRLRAGEVVSLAVVTGHLVECLLLVVGFDAFGDDLEFEGVAEPDDGFADDPAVRVVTQAADERVVDLEDVDGYLPEVAERGVAGAEI